MEIAPAGGDSPTEDMFKLIVRQDGAQVEEYDRATVTRGKQNIATMVNPQSKVIRIEDTNAGPNEKACSGHSRLAGSAGAYPGSAAVAQC